MERIGLQLYSIKELTEKDFLGTLKEVARVGYEGVEFAGYFNTPAGELKKAMTDLGLRAAGSHIGIDKLMNDLNGVIEYSLEIGDAYIICPYLPTHMVENADAYKRTAELFNTIGERCLQHGLPFGYHNHDFEFRQHDGEYGLDLLANNTQPNLLFIELDTFWVEFAGLKSVDFINKYGARCRVLHIKDRKNAQEEVNTEIGKGTMDFPTIVAAGKNVGVDWFTIEQEYFDIPQLQSIAESYQYLRSIL